MFWAVRRKQGQEEKEVVQRFRWDGPVLSAGGSVVKLGGVGGGGGGGGGCCAEGV